MSKVQTLQVGLEDLERHYFVRLSTEEFDDDLPTKTLRTSLRGETGLWPHTSSTRAGMYNYQHHYWQRA